MTLAAVDRLVHHGTVFEMNVESYRRRAVLQRQSRSEGRKASRHSRLWRKCRAPTIKKTPDPCQR
ncbi:MAG TPA: hypothetical protein VLU73_11740, partial [Methylococcaceae bacterium]|nr:hypothetical protein [Methylococcaceae bacterium]